MKSAFTAGELKTLAGISIVAIHKRAQKHGWQFTTEKNPKGGGICKRYLTRSMDADFKLTVSTALSRQAPPPAAAPRRASSSPAGTHPLNQKQIDQALAKADLLRAYRAALGRCGWGNKSRARKQFMRAYNSGLVYEALFERLGKLSWKTIEGWKRQLADTGDPLTLADQRGGWKRGASGLNEDQEKILLRCALHPNRPKISEVIRLARDLMHKQGVNNGQSDATYRRWLNQWRRENHHLWIFTRQGAKAWNDQCAFYIERDYSLIEVGDILVADGHTLNFEILNPWTGKPKRMTLIVWLDMKSSYPLGWEIMPTENTAAISSSLRRAILRLGKLPRVAYLDNGKAFASRFFNGADLEQAGFAGLYERLGIQAIFAWPYHGQSKTVERFFGTFAELERWAPTYVGTSIDKKPPRLNRGEKLHRRVYEHMTDGRTITLEQAHRAIAAWFDHYARRPQSGHLAGATPAALFEAGKGPGVDAGQLDLLMMAQEIRTINRNGIHFLGQNYYSPQLYGRRHAVTIRYDLQDRERVLVYEPDGGFICEARPVEKIHPAARILGSDADRERLERQVAHKKSQEKQAGATARAFLEAEVIPEHRRRMIALGLDGEREAGGQVRRLPRRRMSAEEAKKITEDAGRIEAEVLTEAPEVETIPEVEVGDAADQWEQIARLPDGERYERYIELEVRGCELPPREAAWCRYFEQTPTYQGHEDDWEEFRARMATLYQTETMAM